MGANSIRTNLSRDSTISEIRLCKSADIAHEYVHLIVEGPDDIRFFRFNTSEKAILYESFSGKIGVIDIVSHFSTDNVIGVCDRDYDSLDPSEPIFYYDRSCLETMLIADDKTFEKTCCSLYPDVLDYDTVHTQIFESLRWLSLFRKIDANEGFHLNFKSISIAKAFKKQDRSLDISILLAQLCDANREFFYTHRDCLSIVTQEMQKSVDSEQLILDTRGHDCLEMFHCLCKPKAGKDCFNGTSILTALICAFDFSQSKSYHDLSDYGCRHNLRIVI